MAHSLKTSDAGEMHVITHGGVTCYHIFTKAGFFRGGKIYSQDKIFRVLSGEVELIYCHTVSVPSPVRRGLGGGFVGEDSQGVNDIHETLTPKNAEKFIPAGTPHIFRAITDCVFTEFFPENTDSDEYEKYRAMKI